MIFIGTFSKAITDADLAAFFAANGVEVSDVHVMRDPLKGSSRGFGIGNATNPVYVIAACNGKLLNGYSVIVKET